MPELDRELGFDTDLDVGTQETEEAIVANEGSSQVVDVFGFSPEQNIIHDNENESHQAEVGHEIDVDTKSGGDASKITDFTQPEVEIGEQSTPVVVVTPEKKVHANMPIVKDVEEIGGRGDVQQDIDIEELKSEMLKKADLIGMLPHFAVLGSDNVNYFCEKNNIDETQPIVFTITDRGSEIYIGRLSFLRSDTIKSWSLFSPLGCKKHTGTVTSGGYGLKFSDIVADSYTQKLPKIYKYNEGTVLDNEIFNPIENGDIIQVDSTYFTITKDSTSSPKKITATALSSITATTISIYALNWEYGAELEPTLTTFTVATEQTQSEE